MAYDLTILEEGCRELGITLDEIQKKQFTDFYEYLVEKNKVMNLTGITEFQEVLIKHFLDSLACVKAVDMSRIKRIMDIGTGAGFPGVPLKIASGFSQKKSQLSRRNFSDAEAGKYYSNPRQSRRICEKQTVQRDI